MIKVFGEVFEGENNEKDFKGQVKIWKWNNNPQINKFKIILSHNQLFNRKNTSRKNKYINRNQLSNPASIITINKMSMFRIYFQVNSQKRFQISMP